MQSGSKRINPSHRAKIDTLKSLIRFAKDPLDGTGYPFKTAIAELRKQGEVIIHDKKMCRYYNAKTINEKWNYSKLKSNK